MNPRFTRIAALSALRIKFSSCLNCAYKMFRPVFLVGTIHRKIAQNAFRVISLLSLCFGASLSNVGPHLSQQGEVGEFSQRPLTLRELLRKHLRFEQRRDRFKRTAPFGAVVDESAALLLWKAESCSLLRPHYM
uniref:Uncharacterized protein n=1 Tax=Parascaris univalens TaxID=6257 RepID=A0A915AFD9_PARUN